MLELAKKAKEASATVALLSSNEKNEALLAISEALLLHQEEIKKANAEDMIAGQKSGMSKALLDRLLLTDQRINDMAQGLVELSAMSDPVGRVDNTWHTPSGLEIARVSVPLGVIAMIYEARPNVTVDAAGLCLKSGNVVILRGSRSAIQSNKAIVRVIQNALKNTKVPVNAVQLVEKVDHASVNELLQLSEYIDLAIPRGGAKLIQSVTKNSSVPVIATGTGNCHIYIDEHADLAKGLNILINGKVQRPGVCNALETLLVHESVANEFLPIALQALKDNGVEIRGCERTCAIDSTCKKATEEDYATEFHDLIIAVRIVSDMEEAIAHINRYGSGHSEVMISEHYTKTRTFLRQIDAACVYINASSRFSDGHEFGFGAEIGISTQKMHARGPMGIAALTSFKYTILGEGQIRS